MRYTGPELCAMTATEVVGLLRRREVSPDEVIDAALARMDQVEPLVNAVPTRCEARARGRVAAGAGQAGEGQRGWLAGLPIGIKDLTEVEGVRTTWGNPALADHVPAHSAPIVERLEGRGAVVLGKTNTPEFGAGANTFNAVFGPTFNAWNTTLNAGGSSGGAAVSLATGSFWLAHGSDHGGSLRTPAAYNGVVGLRPSHGLVANASATGFIGEGVEGPMARSVTDVALFLDAMTGFDPVSPLSFPPPAESYAEAVNRAKPGVRLAFAPDLGGLSPVEPEVAEGLARAMRAVEAAGGQVEEVSPDLEGLERAYHTRRGIMWAAAFRDAPAEVKAAMKPTLRENTAFGWQLGIEDVVESELVRSRLYDEMRALLERHDALACPVVGNMPRPQSEEWVREVAGVPMQGYMDWLRFAFLATLTGLPAISVPVGLGPSGVPIGVQLIGPPRGEARLLKVARAVEMAVGWQGMPIDPVVGPVEGPEPGSKGGAAR